MKWFLVIASVIFLVVKPAYGCTWKVIHVDRKTKEEKTYLVPVKFAVERGNLKASCYAAPPQNVGDNFANIESVELVCRIDGKPPFIAGTKAIHSVLKSNGFVESPGISVLNLEEIDDEGHSLRLACLP